MTDEWLQQLYKRYVERYGEPKAEQQKQRDPRTRNIPVLALTAHAMRGDKDRFLQAGCDGYISKPIDVKTFLASIEPFVRRS